MYTLNIKSFGIVNKNKIVQFIEFWERYYQDNVKLQTGAKINYIDELNIGSDLSEQNIISLLRWKDPRMLTHPKVSSKNDNPHVISVLRKIGQINMYRRGILPENKFYKITQDIFPAGFIWKIFIRHIARPTQWPIADQNVFRSYVKLFNPTIPSNLTNFNDRTYCDYTKYFFELADNFINFIGVDKTDINAVVRANKRFDNALFAFGQFLYKYDC